MDFEPLAVITRPVTPTLIVAWIAVSAVVALVPSKKTESDKAIRGRRVLEPAIFAMAFVIGAAVWHQLTGDFVAFGDGWPSAVAAGFGIGLFFVAFVNAQERIAIALSALLVVIGTIMGSLFFSFALFLLPWVMRWEWGLFGLQA